MYTHWFQNYYGHWATPVWGSVPFLIGFLFVVAIIWSFVWKGMALWKASRRGEMAWFVILLVVNTLGILEILYIYVFSKKSEPAPTPIEK